MRILQLCNKIPYPVVDGGTAAMHQLGEGLANAGHHVKVLAVHTYKQDLSVKDLDESYKNLFQPEYVYLDTKVKLLPAFLNLFSSASYNVERFDSPLLHEKIQTLLTQENYDAVILDSLFVSAYIPTIRKYSKAKIILRAHNVEHLVWERKSFREKKMLKRSYLRLLASRLKKHEFNVIPQVDGVAAISLEDVEFFKKNFPTPVEFIPFGFEVNSSDELNNFNNLSGYFLGSMDWQPNQEAVSWMKENIFYELNNSQTGFQLTIAGNKMPEVFFHLTNSHIKVKGKVDNPADFLNDFGVLLAPVFSGGGLKIKVVEAMANGKLVITTPIGAEGLGATPGKHFVLCHTKKDFLTAIEFCVREKQKAFDVALAGMEFIRKHFNPDVITRRMIDFIQSIEKR